MRLTTVGTGTAAPHPRRVQSGTLVESGSTRLLIDCGSGVVSRMAELGIDWAGITHVAITHFHADHTSDLATLIYAWRYGLLPPRSAPAVILGPPGLAARLDAMKGAFGSGLLDAPPEIAVVELPPEGPVPVGEDLLIECRPVPHTEESVAYSVSSADGRVVITGDTGFDRALGTWAAGCDVLVCECSLPESLALPTHLTPRQCGMLAALAAPRRLALTHFYPPVELEPIAEQVAGHFDGPVTLCEDGWFVSLEDL